MSETMYVAWIMSPQSASVPKLEARAWEIGEKSLRASGVVGEVTRHGPEREDEYAEYNENGVGIGEPIGWHWAYTLLGEKP